MHFGKHTATSIKDRRTPNVMQTFTRGTLVGGKQWKFKFANGFGASVIDDGYGRESGQYELAVLGPDDHLTYDTPITDDVLGFLTEDEVADALDRIEALSADGVEAEIARPTISPVVQAATDLRSVLWAAEFRRLPLPFVVRAYDYDAVPTLQFHTLAEVATWAEAMGVDVSEDGMTATGELLDVTVTVCAYVAEVAS